MRRRPTAATSTAGNLEPAGGSVLAIRFLPHIWESILGRCVSGRVNCRAGRGALPGRGKRVQVAGCGGVAWGMVGVYGERRLWGRVTHRAVTHFHFCLGSASASPLRDFLCVLLLSSLYIIRPYSFTLYTCTHPFPVQPHSHPTLPHLRLLRSEAYFVAHIVDPPARLARGAIE
jgi:hypothetical protein